jgi:predicted chitinase
MNSVISAFKDWQPSYDPNAYYLFVVPSFSESTLAGFMPRSRRFGFVTPNQLDAQLVAHELGHGAFNLRHTFPAVPQGTTDNLMDYSHAHALLKPQWDLIHNPETTTGLFDGMEEGAMLVTGGTFTTQICDSTVKDKGVYYLPTIGSCKLYAQFDLKDTTTIKEAKVKLTVAISGTKTTLTKDYTIKLNKKIELQVDSLPDGKYTLNCTADKQSTEKTFYLRKKKYDFACSVCGRDLSLTLAKLNLIFPGNKNITQTHVDYLNDALKKGGFTTCKRHAHFFSQVYVESGNFTDFEEDYWYRLLRIFEIFGNQSNDSYKTLYCQDFWDKNQHLNYISANKCAHLYEGKDTCTDIKDKSKRYKGSGTITKTRNGYTITFPESFTKDTTGTYIKSTITDDKKCGENLFNLVYKDKNGNTQVGDGWKYRGRGAMQVTGRENYRKTSDKCNNTFSKSFNWENNPDQLKTDTESIIYSAVAWFLIAFNPISTLDTKTSNQVTGTVNTKGEKAVERAQKYNDLMNDFQLYNCETK